MLLVNGKRKNEGLQKLSKPMKFELVGGFTFESPNLKTQQGEKYVRTNKTYKLPTTYTAYDETSNTNVEYRYAVQEIPVSDGKGGMYNKYTPSRVVFTSTYLIVQENQPDLYEFLIKSPWFEGNEKNKNPKFKLVDAQKTAQYKIDLERKMMQAKTLILHDEKCLPEPTLRRIASEFKLDGSLDLDVVKENLLAIVESKEDGKGPNAFLKYANVDSKPESKNTPGREEKEVRLRELADLLGEPDLKKGFHLIKDEKFDIKLAEAEVRWKKEETFRGLVTSAEANVVSKNYEEAKGFFEDALKIKPNDSNVKTKLAEVTKQLVPA